jgi:hypothetical protein
MVLHPSMQAVAWHAGCFLGEPSGSQRSEGRDVALERVEERIRRTIGTPGPKRTRLLRRLTITCPVTGLATDTGVEPWAVPVVVGGPHLLVDCLECGQDHPWDVDDAVLAL